MAKKQKDMNKGNDPGRSATVKDATKPKRPARRSTVFYLSGYVTHRDTGKGFVGLRVDAVDKDLRYEQPLGSTSTDDQGRYEIAFTSAQIGKVEKGGPDIIVRVFDQTGTAIGESEIRRNVPTEVTINLVVAPKSGPQQSEYEKLLAELTFLLQEVHLADLKGEDIDFLAKKTGLDKQHIKFLVQSSKLAQETDLPAEVFYGFARQELPLALKRILSKGVGKLHAVLETSIKRNVAPIGLSEILDEIMRRLETLQRRRIPIGELAEAVGLDIPPALRKALKEAKIETLADIRRAGGLSNIKKLNFNPKDPLIEELDVIFHEH